MAAGQGFKTFVTGEVLTADNVNGYLMQGVWVFANSAARSSAVTSPQEGNMSFLKDTNSVEYYTGSAWAAVAGGSSFSGTRLTKSAGQTIANNTDTMVTWNVEDFDVGGYHDNSSNTSRVTIPSGKAGYYQINVTLDYAANGTGQRVITLAKNGTNRAYNLNIIRAVNSGGYTSVFYSDIVYGAVADYFEISTFQDSGGDLNIIGNNGDAGACYFSFSLIGA